MLLIADDQLTFYVYCWQFGLFLISNECLIGEFSNVQILWYQKASGWFLWTFRTETWRCALHNNNLIYINLPSLFLAKSCKLPPSWQMGHQGREDDPTDPWYMIKLEKVVSLCWVIPIKFSHNLISNIRIGSQSTRSSDVDLKERSHSSTHKG